MNPSEEEILARLTGVASAVDAPSAQVFEAAKAAFGLRELDLELAELVADSVESEGAVRGPSSVRLLAYEYEAGDVSVDVEVSPTGDRRRLVGQLSGGGDLRVDTPASSRVVAVDELGRFVADNVPAGPVRLRTTTASGRAIGTAWTTI